MGEDGSRRLCGNPWFYAAYANAVLLCAAAVPLGVGLAVRVLIMAAIAAVPFALMALGWDRRTMETSAPRGWRADLMFRVAAIALTPVNLVAWGVMALRHLG